MAQRGNILFLILLAIILFVALTYAVNSGMRGGGKSGSDESAQAGAAAISQYVTLMRNEVQRLMLVNGCTVSNLDWRHDYWLRANGFSTYYNSSMGPALSPKAGCAVFTKYGGPIAPQSFEQYASQVYIDAAGSGAGFKGGHAAIRWVNRLNEGTSAEDIAFIIGGIRADVCRALFKVSSTTPLVNDTFDITQNPNEAPTPVPAKIDTPANLTGDFFSDTGSSAYCDMVGAIIVPQ